MNFDLFRVMKFLFSNGSDRGLVFWYVHPTITQQDTARKRNLRGKPDVLHMRSVRYVIIRSKLQFLLFFPPGLKDPAEHSNRDVGCVQRGAARVSIVLNGATLASRRGSCSFFLGSRLDRIGQIAMLRLRYVARGTTLFICDVQ